MSQPLGFFVISTELGGAEKSLLDFLKVFKTQHSNITVITPKATGPLIDQLRSLDIQVSPLPLPSFVLSLSRNKLFSFFVLLIPSLIYSLVYLRKINSLINKHSFKSVHSTGLKYHIWLSLISLIQPQTQFHIHIRDIIKLSPIKSFFTFFKKRKNVNLIFNSKATAQALKQQSPTVIYNGFDTEKLFPGPSRLKEDLGLSEEQTLIGIVGVIARWKGQREFLHMAHALSAEFENLHFVVVGDEIYDTSGEKGELTKLKGLQKQLKLESNLHFMGFQKNIEQVYRGLDLLLHCSITPEPFGRVLVEAMLCGCPVVAANRGGPLEIIDDRENGLLYTSSDLNSLIETTREVLRDSGLRQKLTNNGLSKAQDFSLDAYVSALGKQILAQSDRI